MSHYTGELVELLLESYQNATARVALPPAALPAPGQYLQTHRTGEAEAVLPTTLFAAGAPHVGRKQTVLPVIGNLPAAWEPGARLQLRGPLGKGFALPKRLKRLALVALGSGPGRLLPLVPLALKTSVEVALFSTPSSDVRARHASPLPEDSVGLPLEVEQQPLGALPEALAWADFLAVDLSLEQVDSLPSLLGSEGARRLSGQALVHAPMPCGGLAACGVCAVSTNKGEKLACEDGPVFLLADLI